ncbi:MAG: exosome complex protein Rrp4 [Nanoarchaeota archaeon]|nr:exosome complex protein Rrp4 [Nanoarchaeota archaeon]
MGEIKIKEKEVVVPGEVLATGMDCLPSYGTYRMGDDIRAAKLGLVRIEGKVVKITPLSGRYLPKRGDTIIANVYDIIMSGWLLKFNSAYHAMLSMKEATSRFIQKGADLTRIYALGDYVVCSITNVTSQKLVDVTMRGPGFRKLEGGRIIEVNTNKVPRVIGKEGSMVGMIKNATNCRITVGQNGIVWIQGEPEMENIAIDAIKKAEAEAHTDGLTDRIKEFLEKKLGKKIDLREHAPERRESPSQEHGFRNEDQGFRNQDNQDQYNDQDDDQQDDQNQQSD